MCRTGVITTELGTYRTPVAGTRAQYVQARGALDANRPACARYVPNARGGYASLYVPTEALGRTCQLSDDVLVVHPAPMAAAAGAVAS